MVSYSLISQKKNYSGDHIVWIFTVNQEADKLGSFTPKTEAKNFDK